jgi:hypothetical protein
MAINDLSVKEQVVLNYMEELLRVQFPNLDLSEHGAFMETFGLPHIKLLTPLMDAADRIKLTQSLDNAEDMTEEEMDRLAAGYFFYRQAGEYATGYVTMTFDDIPANGTIQIPAGTEVQSKQGLYFKSISTVVLNINDLSSYYNPDEFIYQIPVLFESENPGADYNVESGEITTVITPLNHLTGVSNDAAFKGGKAKETNTELADRIQETAGTPNLGVERGWVAFAKQFPEVLDVIVAGFGHPLMKRDVIGTLPADRIISTLSPDVHWGGKVDLHLRGKKLTEVTETLTIEKNASEELFVPLSNHPTHDILEITFTSSRYTDPKLDPSFFQVKDFLLMKDEDTETMGTVNESSWAIIIDDRLLVNDTVTVRYRYNQLFEDINAALYTEDNRPPASDVLLKEAIKKTVQGAAILKLESYTGIQEKDKSVIRQRLYNWIDELKMGSELQTSDFTEPIYDFGSDSIDSKVDYISLPTQFMVTDYDNKYLYYCMNQEKRDFLDEIMANSTYFTEWIPYFRDNVTVYDFFDVMHLLTVQNVEKDAWKTLSYKDHEWGKKVYFFGLAKTMLAYVNSIQRMSPSKWVAKENAYYELGNLSIYEDVTYTDTELQNLIELFESISNPNVDNDDDYVTDNILHLTIYCCTILYVITTDNVGGLTTKDFFSWLSELSKGTPIDYEVQN